MEIHLLYIGTKNLVRIHSQKSSQKQLDFVEKPFCLGSKNQQKSLLDFREARFLIFFRGFKFSAASLSHYVLVLSLEFSPRPCNLRDCLSIVIQTLSPYGTLNPKKNKLIMSDWIEHWTHATGWAWIYSQISRTEKVENMDMYVQIFRSIISTNKCFFAGSYW